MRPIFPVASRVMRRRTGQGMDSFFRARYCPHRLRRALTSVFKDRTLAELTRARVMVPAVNLTLGQTKIFRTPHLPGHEADRGLKIVDVLRAATAAPTYFPHKMMPDGHSYCDGGVWANAPAVVAVAEALKIRQLCDLPHDMSTVELLAIGTGRISYSLKPPGGDAGILYWAGRIADVMGISQMQGVEIPMEYVLGDRYHSVDFDLPDRTWSLDGVHRIPDLMALGRASADERYEAIKGRLLLGPAAPYVPFSGAQAA
jgi:predicted acylesterase/phospholipase RssA